jgi:hypothetical protein
MPGKDELGGWKAIRIFGLNFDHDCRGFPALQQLI